MAKLNFKLHPLFILFGIYFAFTGKVFSFIIFTLSALIHELGHYASSEKYGYKLKKIVLMPYGALIVGNSSGIRYKDECKIALAGPLLNLLISVVFIALWWVFPATYPFTEEIVIANLSLALINLLPCFPLDGGRVLLATLSLITKRKTALKIVKILGVLLALSLVGLFVYSIFVKVNFTILFFATFILVGALFNGKEGEFIKTFESFTFRPPLNPLLVKRVAVGKSAEVKSLYPIINGEYYYEVEVDFNGCKYILEGEKLYCFLSTQSGYEKIETAIKKFTQGA